MEPYKIAIVDDEPQAIALLKEALGGENSFCLCGEASTAAQARELILSQQPDLLFLDIQLPDLTGMELLRQLQDELTWSMKVVYYTAYDEYMLDAIRQSAFDYLLKPFHPDELATILARFLQTVRQEPPRLASFGTQTAGEQPFMVVTPTGDMRVVRPSEVGLARYISERKQWYLVLVDQPLLPLRRGLTADQLLQFSSRFVQIHQSIIINTDYLMLIRDNVCQLYPPFDRQTDLIISKKHRKDLLARFV